MEEYERGDIQKGKEENSKKEKLTWWFYQSGSSVLQKEGKKWVEKRGKTTC